MRFEMLLPRWLYEGERLVVFVQKRFCYPGHIMIKFASGTGVLEEVNSTITE